MAIKSDNQSGLIADINVTPLVDITLVLLIIFMVAAPMIMNKALKVDLPKAATGKAPKQTTVALTIKADGSVYVNGKRTERKALASYLRAEAAKQPKIRAIVSADRAVTHGTVVGYLDLLNRSGISRYAVSVEQPAEKSVAEKGK